MEQSCVPGEELVKAAILIANKEFDTYMATIITGMNPRALSVGDRDLLEEYIFQGISRGTITPEEAGQKPPSRGEVENCAWCGAPGHVIGRAMSFPGVMTAKCTKCHHEWETTKGGLE